MTISDNQGSSPAFGWVLQAMFGLVSVSKVYTGLGKRYAIHSSTLELATPSIP